LSWLKRQSCRTARQTLEAILSILSSNLANASAILENLAVSRMKFSMPHGVGYYQLASHDLMLNVFVSKKCINYLFESELYNPED